MTCFVSCIQRNDCFVLFLVVTDKNDAAPPADLLSARATDAAMADADADTETDPSVSIVTDRSGTAGGDRRGRGESGGGGGGGCGESGESGARVGSEDATPPPEHEGDTLADMLARKAARGEEMPGIEDDDGLLSDAEEDNPRAVAEEAARKQQFPRVKSKAYVKDPVTVETESDTDLAMAPRQKKSRRGKDGAGKASAEPAPRTRPTQEPKRKVPVTRKAPAEESSSESQEEVAKSTSRHLPVNASQIYKDWNGPLLQAVRRRFQYLMMARDGWPLKSQAGYKPLNFKLLLRSAREIMPLKEGNAFCAQMERAFRDTEKS